MFEDLFGNVQKQQDELAARLAEIQVQAELGDGSIKVTATADQQIKNIEIDPTKFDLNDVEQLEDLLLAVINEALEKGRNKAAAETQKIIGGMLPPGLGGMFGQ